MKKDYLMGNGAIALGALAAGINLVSGYPGTPSSEILETVSKYKQGDVHVEWSVNEKAALELAASASYAGARTLVTMKQVGLNVASDPLMSLAYVGVKGGMVIVSADDPGPISSQTEQDTRMFASFCRIPVFDPSSPEEAFSMIKSIQDSTHKVYTGVTLIKYDFNTKHKEIHSFFESTDVTLYPMTDLEISSYISTGDCYDKAGGYGIQGQFAVYVKGINGDYNNVVGLPIAHLYHELNLMK